MSDVAVTSYKKAYIHEEIRDILTFGMLNLFQFSVSSDL